MDEALGGSVWVGFGPRILECGVGFRQLRTRRRTRPGSYVEVQVGFAGNLFPRVRLGTSNLNSFCQLL